MATYKVEHISNSNVITDITVFVHSVDYVNFYSDGRINTASLTLQGSAGKFQTNDTSGTTPILSNFDRLRITGTDSQLRSYTHIFEIINDLSQLNNSSEYLVPLTLEGRERALSVIPFSGYFDALTHFDMVEKILNTYFVTHNVLGQPLIISEDDFLFDTNLLPKFSPNIWDFQYVDNCLDAIQAVVRLANQSVAAFGGGDRFAIIFEDSGTTPLSKMTIRIISQGTTNAGTTFPIIIANDLINPIRDIAKTKQPLTGTVVIARGKPGSGGVPVSGDIYRSRLEFYQRIQARQSWTQTIFYKTDSYTSFDNQVYQALNDNNNDQPPSANWVAVSAGTFIGDIQYSPFTIDKAALYKNECTNPGLAFASEIEASPKMLDCNIVINDSETQRDWVHIRQNTDNLTTWSDDERRYLFRGNEGVINGESVYDGFRILVDTAALGNAIGPFNATVDNFGTGAGNDPNGKPYANNQAVRVNKIWYVIKEHADFDQTLVRFEGLFEWNIQFQAGSRFPASDLSNNNRRKRQAGSTGSFAWRTLGAQFLSNDCLHSPSSITNVTGLIDPVAHPVSGNYTDNSAVRIIYEYSSKSDMPEWRKVLDQLLGVAVSATGFVGSFALNAAASLYDLFLTPYYRNAGWWITLSAPFPFSNFNGISEQVGQLYGAGTGLLVDKLNDHNTFDAFNQTYTFTGDNSWNAADSSGLMEISGVTFLFKLNITADGTTIPFTGDISCSYWVIDDNGTIWKSKKKYRQINDVQRMTFEFGDFSPVYRARTPFGINNIITNILVPELEIRERLFANRIRIQGFMLEGAYDDKGRYMPNLWENIIKPTIFTMFDNTSFTTNVKFIGDIDYFQWVKTPIAISKATVGIRHAIFPEFKDYPNISNIEQLQRAADADLDVELFQYEQYDMNRNNKADIQLQDSVYLFESKMINQNEAPIPTALQPEWDVDTNYSVGEFVGFPAFPLYISLRNDNLGNIPNVSPDFWEFLTTTVPHTRLLTVGAIQFSVTNAKEVQFMHTLIRRIPRVT